MLWIPLNMCLSTLYLPSVIHEQVMFCGAVKEIRPRKLRYAEKVGKAKKMALVNKCTKSGLPKKQLNPQFCFFV